MAATKDIQTRSPSGRVKRGSIGPRQRLSVQNKDPNYEYRFVNDTDNRIDLFKERGWEIVPYDSVKIGDKRVDVPGSEGSAAYISVGGGNKACLMRIPKEWYAEDQAAKQAEVDKSEQTMKQDALRGNYGKLEVTKG